MKKSNIVLTTLAISGLLFSLIVIFFVDVDGFEDVKELSYLWLGLASIILAFFGGFFIMFSRK